MAKLGLQVFALSHCPNVSSSEVLLGLIKWTKHVQLTAESGSPMMSFSSCLIFMLADWQLLNGLWMVYWQTTVIIPINSYTVKHFKKHLQKCIMCDEEALKGCIFRYILSTMDISEVEWGGSDLQVQQFAPATLQRSCLYTKVHLQITWS